MSRHREWNLACKVYIGNLGNNASKYEIEEVFNKYGKLKNVWVARNPPGFAFVEFEDERDAEDSVRALDGTRICGVRASVEMSSGRSRRRGGGGGGGGRERGGRDFRGDRGRERYGSGGGGFRDDRGGRDRGYGDRSRSRSRDRSYGGRGGDRGSRRRSPSHSPDRSYSRERSHSRDNYE